MSSASMSSCSSTVMLMAARQSFNSGIWPLNSGGVSDRLALYSVYSRVRKDCREVSKATAIWVGFSALIRLISIARNPYTPLVCCPSRVEKLSTGRA